MMKTAASFQNSKFMSSAEGLQVGLRGEPSREESGTFQIADMSFLALSNDAERAASR